MSTSDEQTAELQLEPPQEDEASATDGSHYVTFCVEGELFAVPMAPVQEIIRVPGIVHLPLAPSALDGLANLRGKVLPILSLRRLFGLPDRAADEATRALVRACTEFCVNGHLAGNCHLVWRHNELEETRRA